MRAYLVGLGLCLGLLLPMSAQAVKVAVVSTEFVLSHKFSLMEQSAAQANVTFDWVQVDAPNQRGGREAVARALQGADLVLIDSPRNDDQAKVEQIAGGLLKALSIPVIQINRMTRDNRLRAINIDVQKAEQVMSYYLSGMTQNRGLLFDYVNTLVKGGDLSQVSPPIEMPNGGIYHADYEQQIFSDLASYRQWWKQAHPDIADTALIVAMETTSSYVSDGQTQHLNAVIKDLEKRGVMPLVFYRESRTSERATNVVNNAQTKASDGMPVRSSGSETKRPDVVTQPMSVSADATKAATAASPFPNPKQVGVKRNLSEPLITENGKLLPQVLLVNTFLGGDVEGRKARYQQLGIPVLNVVHYQEGDKQAYLKDLAGVSSFRLPFTLTTAEYIGIQDPVVLTSKESGEMITMPEQLDLLVGKAVKLARLALKSNADKKLALLFWNHPPGEKNQGASNMNVPRSIEKLVKDLKAQGYQFSDVKEQQMIDAVASMLQPRYRANSLDQLMKTDLWAFMPLATYQAWFQTLPASVQAEMNQFWGDAEKNAWVVEHQGQKGFVIPRLALGNLIVLPQPSRGGSTAEQDKNLFHDTKKPMNHYYAATYLWLRSVYETDALIHFGTHGTQEWHPGKERGLWAYDYPNLAVGNTPVVYPYIVDNIGEALHVKRRGRGVIVSYQVPSFSPAGLSDEFVVLNEHIREYQSLDEGLVKANAKDLIIETAIKMHVPEDINWKVADIHAKFDVFLRELENYLEDLGSAMQPLGLHTFGESAENEHIALNVMLMLGDVLTKPLGIEDTRRLFKDDYQLIKQSKPFKFVLEHIVEAKPLLAADASNSNLVDAVQQGIQFVQNMDATSEIKGISAGLSAKWVDPSYGGDPIRNPDALPTGRNMYGFDPSRIPTKAAYEAGVQAMKELIISHQATHGEFPKKLTFSMWSTETLRHLGMLEAQIFYAMGVKPIWDKGGVVTGLEVIPLSELGRPRIDTVISLTGLYRDQFPNVMERFNEAITLLASLDESLDQNYIKANSLRIEDLLLKQGVDAKAAKNFALTRVFGTESGDYGTKLPDATLASDKWDEKDGKLAELYLSRMSWAYGPDSSQWSQKLTDAAGKTVNVYAEQLKGTSAAVFSRSSNLRGLLDTDHPFEYLGGISLALQHLEGKAPQMYISNMRDPKKAKLQTAENFMATELRAVYQHPNWVKEMQQEGYAGTLQMLNTINNFWGWQVMDRKVVRDDQWQQFHEVYIKDKYNLDMKAWFEQSNPTAMAQIAERMLEAIRKDYWKASDETKKELVQLYQELSEKYDVHTDNQTFKAYVAELAAGYGLSATPAPTAEASAAAAVEQPSQQEQSQEAISETVQGQVMQEQQPQPTSEPDSKWWLLVFALILVGAYQQHRRRQLGVK